MADPLKQLATFPMGTSYQGLGLPYYDDQQGTQGPLPIGMVNLPEMPAPLTTTSPISNSDKLYGYAMLSALLGSAGASLGQAFRPWVKPPQALPSPQAPQMPITAPAALQALTQTRQARKGF